MYVWCVHVIGMCVYILACIYRTVACPEKMGGGGAQSNFPTRDHQNKFNLILTYIYIYLFWKIIGGGGEGGHRPL